MQDGGDHGATDPDAQPRGAAMLRFVTPLVAAFFLSFTGEHATRADEPPIALLSSPHEPGIQNPGPKDPSLPEKWRVIQRMMQDDETRLAACRADHWMCSDDELRLEAISAAGRAREGRARIGEVNRAVNLSIRPASDEKRFGVADRWSGPLDTVAAGEGDCEDYAILKLLALREAGIARGDLRLVIVRDRGTGSDHAVAAARLDGRWLLLDNRFLALVDLEQTPYRVLAQFGPDADGLHFAAIGASDPESLPGMM
jgi:predicted transglutaminase-like cysteine proteinase